MAEGPRQEIEIVSVATGTGAADTVKGMEGVTAATTKATEATQRFNAAGDTSAMGPKTAATTENVIQQRREILALVLQQSRAIEQGNYEEAAGLADTIEKRRMALQIQQQAQVTELRSLGIAGEIVSIKANETAQMDAQAALNESLVAQETARLALESEMQEALNQRLVKEEMISQAKEAQAIQEQVEIDQAYALLAAHDRYNAAIVEEALGEEGITAQLAAQTVEVEAQGTALRGIGMIGRGAGMLAGAAGFGAMAGEIGFAVFAAYELYHVIESIAGVFTKAAEEQKKIGVEADNVIRKINDEYDASVKLKEPIDRWKESIEDAKLAMDDTLKATDVQIAALDKVAAAQEKLEIAKIEGDSTLSPEEKAKKKGETEAAYDKDKGDRDKKRFDAEIEAEEKKRAISLAGMNLAYAEQEKAEKQAASARDKAIKSEQKEKALKLENAALDAQIEKDWIARSAALLLAPINQVPLNVANEAMERDTDRKKHLQKSAIPNADRNTKENQAASTAADADSKRAQEEARKSKEELIRQGKESDDNIANIKIEAKAEHDALAIDAQTKPQEAANKAAADKAEAEKQAQEDAKRALAESLRTAKAEAADQDRKQKEQDKQDAADAKAFAPVYEQGAAVGGAGFGGSPNAGVAPGLEAQAEALMQKLQGDSSSKNMTAMREDISRTLVILNRIFDHAIDPGEQSTAAQDRAKLQALEQRMDQVEAQSKGNRNP